MKLTLKTNPSHMSFSIFLQTDPNMWTVDHVQQWVQWAVREYSLADVQVSRFTMEGKQLCKMTRDEFTRLTNSYNADVLLSHLNFLKQGKFQINKETKKQINNRHYLFCFVLLFLMATITSIEPCSDIKFHALKNTPELFSETFKSKTYSDVTF